MPGPDGALGCKERPADLFCFLGKIHRKEWSSRCLGSVPRSFYLGNKHSHPFPLPTDLRLSLILQHNSFLWTCSREEAAAFQRCWPRYGQAIENAARMRQARSRAADKHRVTSTGGMKSSWPWRKDRNQHRILMGQPGSAARFLPEGKHQRPEAEGSQPGGPKAEGCILH